MSSDGDGGGGGGASGLRRDLRWDGAFHAADVHVIGRRVGALVAASRRGANELSPLLDAEASTFVPRRLREAFDSLPHLAVFPVRLSDEDEEDEEDEEEGFMTASKVPEEDEGPEASVLRILQARKERDAVAVREAAALEAAAAPAAYKGPLGMGGFPRVLPLLTFSLFENGTRSSFFFFFFFPSFFISAEATALRSI